MTKEFTINGVVAVGHIFVLRMTSVKIQRCSRLELSLALDSDSEVDMQRLQSLINWLDVEAIGNLIGQKVILVGRNVKNILAWGHGTKFFFTEGNYKEISKEELEKQLA